MEAKAGLHSHRFASLCFGENSSRYNIRYKFNTSLRLYFLKRFMKLFFCLHAFQHTGVSSLFYIHLVLTFLGNKTISLSQHIDPGLQLAAQSSCRSCFHVFQLYGSIVHSSQHLTLKIMVTLYLFYNEIWRCFFTFPDFLEQ